MFQTNFSGSSHNTSKFINWKTKFHGFSFFIPSFSLDTFMMPTIVAIPTLYSPSFWSINAFQGSLLPQIFLKNKTPQALPKVKKQYLNELNNKSSQQENNSELKSSKIISANNFILTIKFHFSLWEYSENSGTEKINSKNLMLPRFIFFLLNSFLWRFGIKNFHSSYLTNFYFRFSWKKNTLYLKCSVNWYFNWGLTSAKS